MGLYSRDYARDSHGDSGLFGAGTPMVTRLIVATVIVFVLQVVITRSPSPADRRAALEQLRETPGFERISDEEIESFAAATTGNRISVVQEWLEFDPEDALFRGQIWRFVTYAFCHDRFGIWHVVFNMLFLWWFGRQLESMYGPREFLLFYLVAAVAAAALFLSLELLFRHPLTPMVGASGAVMGVLMLYAMHFPRERIYVFWGLFPVEVRWFVAFFVIVDLHPILLELGGTSLGDGVAHSAHLGGLLFGFLYRRFDWRLDDLFSRIRRPRFDRWVGSRRKIRLHQPSVRAAQPRGENLDDQVDRLLAKIHDHGEASLTDDEREVLKTASQKYKKR
jgi:membrane associated rhomboid family serine protease